MLQAKLDCSAVKRQSWFKTTSATRVALELDDDAHAVAVGFVAEIRDALDAFLAHQLGDLLDQRGLVDLIGNLGDDQRLALLAQFLDLDLRPGQDRAAPGAYRRRGCRRAPGY